MDAPGLYIHIPFCRRRCHYCSFYSTTSLDLVKDFLKALLREMDTYRADFKEFDTIYIGGGTPSVLSPQDLEVVLEGAAKKFKISSGAEITLEANPADINLSGLKSLRSLGINRIVLGVQSFDDSVLNFLGRRHNRSQAISTMEAVGKVGFDNTGIDLIYGVPGQVISSWMDTLSLVLAYNPAHLSCYQLTVEPGTPLHFRQSKGEIVLPGEDVLADLFFKTSAAIEKAGYSHYEVSNFARGLELKSRHNQKYWNHTPYLGLGPSAHSFRGRKRWWNHRNISAYLRALIKGMPPVAASEILTDDQLQLETMFLGLRTKNGINLEDYKLRYGYDFLSERREIVSLLQGKGMIEIKNGQLKPTLSGFAFADSLALI